jgi:hypothetical protein
MNFLSNFLILEKLVLIGFVLRENGISHFFIFKKIPGFAFLALRNPISMRLKEVFKKILKNNFLELKMI